MFRTRSNLNGFTMWAFFIFCSVFITHEAQGTVQRFFFLVSLFFPPKHISYFNVLAEICIYVEKFQRFCSSKVGNLMHWLEVFFFLWTTRLVNNRNCFTQYRYKFELLNLLRIWNIPLKLIYCLCSLKGLTYCCFHIIFL